jgi:hypothetical protein
MGEQFEKLHQANTIIKVYHHLGESMTPHHQDQVECASKMYDLDVFYFTGLKLVVGRLGYRIDNCTIKRGLSNE